MASHSTRQLILQYGRQHKIFEFEVEATADIARAKSKQSEAQGLGRSLARGFGVAVEGQASYAAVGCFFLGGDGTFWNM